MGNTRLLTASSSRLVFQEVSNLWRATTPDAVNISDNFSQRKIAPALQHLKSGKAPGPDSICPELILHAGAAIQILSNPFMSSSLEGKTGMIAPKQSRQKQRVVIQFLLSEGETAQNISRRLKQAYGDGAIDYSAVTRWVKRINDRQEESAESDLCDRPRSGWPSSAHSSANIDQADALIKENRRITINDLAKPLGVSAESAVKIMDTLGYSKVCARWVPRQVTGAHKQSRLKTCSEHLEYCHSDKTFFIANSDRR